MATLAAVPLHLLLAHLPFWAHLSALLLLLAIAFPCVAETARRLEDEDPQVVVVDEVASILLALLIAAPSDPLQLVATVAVFRVLDIAKPWPIASFERLRPPALGIMADDIAAGLLTGLIILGFATLIPMFA